MRADGSKAHRLTSANGNKLYDYQPTWSPNGRLIAFSSNRIDPSSAITDVWTMRPDGSHKRNLTRSPAVFDVSPDFSPGGGSIAYASRRSGHTQGLADAQQTDADRHRGRDQRVASASSSIRAFSPERPQARVFSSAELVRSDNGLFTAPSGGG